MTENPQANDASRVVSGRPVRQIAVVGSGVAGLTAAYVAAKSARVTLYEADERLGGHADTQLVPHSDPVPGGVPGGVPDGAPDGPAGRTQTIDLAIDTGFIVHNRKTYPTLLRLFAELGIATTESEMSMSVRDEGSGLEYAGARGLRGVFPSVGHIAKPAYLKMLLEIPRFHRRARALLAADPRILDQTLRSFLTEGRFSAYFTRHFMEPLVAAVWSCDPAIALDYPARYLFSFLDHHGMLTVFGSPTWRTVTGGSREYVIRAVAALDEVRVGSKVTSVAETATGVAVTDGNGDTAWYDAAIIATHPDQALAMLAEPTAIQTETFAAMPYSPNTALLHTDTSLLPHNEHARSSWNFLRPARASGRPGADQVTVTYDLTRLMRLPIARRYLVTLGGEDRIDPETVISRREYAHPIYNPTSVAAQRRLPECNTARLAFAGAYHGWGFHEDGARSGVAAASHLGLRWPETGLVGPAATTSPRRTTPRGAEPAAITRQPVGQPVGQLSEASTPRIYPSTIHHTRRTPFTRTFTHRTHTWLVDLDALPDHGLLARFEARDHLGDPSRSIRANVDAFLAGHGIDLSGGRVLMAANARALGYCFNPISVHWCLDAADSLAAVVVEVHNTYGDRQAYLVRPDEQGRAATPKEMYVSPFHGVDGTYQLAVPIPGRTLNIAVTLVTDDGPVFSASLSGTNPQPPTPVSVRRSAPAAARGAVLIRAHGIWLWARRLPVHARPAHPKQRGVW
ncbi:MAG: FAD-dependent oxidoreductase [Nocardioides sp.]